MDWKPSRRWPEWDRGGGCRRCRHWTKTDATCAAYPGEIPLPIASGEVDHLVTRPGDHGIRFEPIDLVAAPKSQQA